MLHIPRTSFDVLYMNCHIVVSVQATLLMIEPKRMEDFMGDRPQPFAAKSNRYFLFFVFRFSSDAWKTPDVQNKERKLNKKLDYLI